MEQCTSVRSDLLQYSKNLHWSSVKQNLPSIWGSWSSMSSTTSRFVRPRKTEKSKDCKDDDKGCRHLDDKLAPLPKAWQSSPAHTSRPSSRQQFSASGEQISLFFLFYDPCSPFLRRDGLPSTSFLPCHNEDKSILLLEIL